MKRLTFLLFAITAFYSISQITMAYTATIPVKNDTDYVLQLNRQHVDENAGYEAPNTIAPKSSASMILKFKDGEKDSNVFVGFDLINSKGESLGGCTYHFFNEPKSTSTGWHNSYHGNLQRLTGSITCFNTIDSFGYDKTPTELIFNTH